MAKQRTAVISKEMLDPKQPGSAARKHPKDYGAALNFRVPPDFIKYFKIACAHRDLNQTELLMELCEPALREFGYE